jgi:hypothetical protein
MSLFRFKDAAIATDASSTPFAEFIRGASAEKKKKIYSKVLRRASESQREVMARVERTRRRK